MSKVYYKRSYPIRIKQIIRLSGLSISLGGVLIMIYIFLPFLSWQVYFAPAFAASEFVAPIPKTTIVSKESIQNLLQQAGNIFTGVDYSNAQNWFPNAQASGGVARVPSFTISIPKIRIKQAIVSTTDYELDKHLVNYSGTAVPPDKGTSVIFGHSTLPQLFNPTDYKTIFANAYTLKVGDDIFAEVQGATYTYRIYAISVVEATDTSIFAQNFDDSYITIVTCTPPGTTWKRLILRAKMQSL